MNLILSHICGNINFAKVEHVSRQFFKGSVFYFKFAFSIASCKNGLTALFETFVKSTHAFLSKGHFDDRTVTLLCIESRIYSLSTYEKYITHMSHTLAYIAHTLRYVAHTTHMPRCFFFYVCT